MRVMASATLVPIVVLILAACGSGSTASPSTGAPTLSLGPGQTDASPDAEPTDEDGSPPAIPSFTGEEGGSFTLVVEGGSIRGTYTSDAASGGCVENAGQLQLALEGEGIGPDGESVFISVLGVMAQASAGTSEFLLTVAVGVAEEGGTVAAYPAQPGNDGNLKVDDRGSSISVAANGTAFGVSGQGASETMKLNLRAVCSVVTRF